MSSIEVLRKELSVMDKKLKSELSNILYEKAKIVLEDFKSRSAVDTGYFRSQWFISKPRFSSGGVNLNLTNNAEYAPVLIKGAEPGQHAPWFYPNRDKKGRFRKGTGKLFIKNNRVWAGGLKPGRSLAAGGVTAGILSNKDFQTKLASDILDAALKAIK